MMHPKSLDKNKVAPLGQKKFDAVDKIFPSKSLMIYETGVYIGVLLYDPPFILKIYTVAHGLVRLGLMTAFL